jgi:hypothetical protein
MKRSESRVLLPVAEDQDQPPQARRVRGKRGDGGGVGARPGVWIRPDTLKYAQVS